MYDRIGRPGHTAVAACTRAMRFVERHPVLFATAGFITVLLVAALVAFGRHEARDGERRVVLRADMASRFVESYIEDLVSIQADAARAFLRREGVDQAEIARIVDATRMDGAVLLDPVGRVDAAHPIQPGLVGSVLALRYAHMRRALRGDVSVSNVVPSATRLVPVIAIATPFRDGGDRKVFSAAYELTSSPLATYLANAMPTLPVDLYLVDAGGVIVAAKHDEPGVATLRERDPELATALRTGTTGTYDGGGAQRFFVHRNVEGTPWRLVAAVPLAEVRDSELGYAWVAGIGLVAVLCAAVLLIAALFARLFEAREHLLDDIDRRERVEAELIRERTLLAHQAMHDPLTGLPNRSLLFARLESAYERAAREPDRRPAILFIDLDRFKPINDAHGHDAGDRVLREIADRLVHAVRPGDTVARLGGDEFAVLCDSLETPESAYAIAGRIRGIVERPVAIGTDRTVSVGASVGIAEHADFGASPRELLAHADADMYEAKARGRARI